MGDRLQKIYLCRHKAKSFEDSSKYKASDKR